MRILFMGTPDFAVASLRRLVEDGHDVCGVFTQPDKPRNRGHKMAFSPVKEYAITQNIPVYQPLKMRDGEALSIVQLMPKADGMVIITTPQDVALLDSRKSLRFGAETRIPIIGIVENMSGFVCPHCGEITDIFKSGGGERAAAELNVQFLGKVPIEPGVVECGDSGMPVVLKYPDSASAKAFKGIVDRIVKTVE